MATTNGNRQILDLKRWEFCTPAPTSTQAGAMVISSRHFRQQQMLVRSTTEAFLYNPSEDGWVTLTSPALAGTLAAGAGGTAGAWSTGSTIGAASLTATAGTTSTITTNQALARDLRGYKVLIMSGPNNGAVLDIVSNTIGASAVITVATQASAFTASTTYRLLTPRFYVLGSGTLAAGSFRVYDYATNTWTTLTITGLAASLATDGKLIATPSMVDGAFKQFATGTATSATATTLVQTGKTWTASQWINYQVRITGGTGAGQFRTITANTADSLTVATWTTTPDATSTYAIEGNDDFLYYMGNNAVTLYRYSISANTWTTLSPTAARAAAPGAGMSGHWVHSVEAADWNNESSIINGDRIYSFRGAAGGVLDYYDISSNTWVSGVVYSPNAETFTTGTKYALRGGRLYIQKDATGRWFAYDFARSELFPWGTTLYPQGAAVVGDTAFDVVYRDGATEIYYVYFLLNTSQVLLRQMVI
jgi:hypothetical protein